ncbi:hypothetical protein D3C71_1910400 [compost metagenome]
MLPCSEWPNKSGSMAQIVAMAVIRIGRIRVPAASSNASRIVICASLCLTRSISTMAFVTTMPISISAPNRAVKSGVTPEISRPTTAPIAASGSENMMASGARSVLKVSTMIR